MIMYSYKKIAVTNRNIFFRKNQTEETYVQYLARLADMVDMIILREKDLEESAYEKLAAAVLQACRGKKAAIVLHTFTDVAVRLGAEGIHLPMAQFEREYQRIGGFKWRGASAHSLQDAKKAQELGASYITLSHIFATDCKAGLEPRGLEFLHEVCEKIRIPVYALGGICAENEEYVIKAGAAGACRMSDYMIQGTKV
jgi:thiamine-phosphate pyrophosphorylase